jgi:type IV pilus assembly protein PilB
VPHDPTDVPVLYGAQGCPACSGTGYRGRVGLHEVMAMTPELEAAVVRSASGADLRELALAQGMTSLRADGWSKVLEGLTTIEEVLRVTV